MIKVKIKLLLCTIQYLMVCLYLDLINQFKIIKFLLGLANNNHSKETINLFKKMSISPNEYTYTIIFKTCSQLNDQESIKFGKELLKTLPNQYCNHTIILNSALHMLMQYGEVLLSEKLFSQMTKDTTSYGVMMSGKRNLFFFF